MRILSIFLALINSLLAGVLIILLVTGLDFELSRMWWSVARIMVALSVIVVSIVSWIEMITPIDPGPLVLGSLFLVAIGPATMVWAFHRASLTGHLEYYMLLYGASLFVQGVSLLLSLSENGGSTSTA